MKLVSLIALSALSLSACNRSEAAKATTTEPVAGNPHAALSPLKVDDVAALLRERAAVPVDANNPETREALGTLPGAILLSDARSYSLNELPPDKSRKLVFYCGSEKCRSAPKAAKRAEAAGYTDVHVMPAGIRGWVKAGKNVDKTS